MITITEQTPKKMPGLSSLFVSFDYNASVVEAVKSMTNATYDKNTRVWEIPPTCLSKLLDKLAPLDEVKLSLLKDKPEKRDKVYDLSDYKTKPYEYQLDGIQYGLNHDKFLLLDAPGLGKSLQIIYLAQELKERENIEHCLIICGINTLKANWKKEIGAHSNLSCRILGERVNTKGKTVIGSVADRLEDLKNPIKEFFVITNIETLRSSDIVKAINKGVNNFDMIVVDEVHTCKSPTSQQGKHLLQLKDAKYKVGATGTLLLNNPLDAYVPLKWIGAERGTFTNYKFYYCNYTGKFKNILVGFRNMDVLKDQLGKFSLRRTKDLLNLPPKTIINEFVDMGDEQTRFYDNIKNGLVDQVDKVHMSTASLLSIVGRLRQATACPSMLTTENIPSAKIERACDLIEQITENGEKVVVFSNFKETLSEMEKKLTQYKPLLCTGDIKDEVISNNIDVFQKDTEHKVMLATWQKMGTGITLTSACYAIFIDTPWTASQCLQCEDRIYRIGSGKPVFIYYLWSNDTIDLRVKEIVETKEALSDYIVDNKMTTKSLESLRKYIEELAK